MVTHKDNNEFAYYTTLQEAKEEGYSPVKVSSLLQFFTFRGKTSKIEKDNLVPYDNLEYVVQSFWDNEERLYLRKYRGYDIDTLYFYRRTINFSGEDDAVEGLRRYVYDGRVWILYTKEHIDQTTKVLQRLYEANLSGSGKLDYRIYLRILDASLKLEDYREYQKSIRGYKTACRIMEEDISALWKEAYAHQSKNNS